MSGLISSFPGLKLFSFSSWINSSLSSFLTFCFGLSSFFSSSIVGFDASFSIDFSSSFFVSWLDSKFG
jgi:hypothetical protein